MAAQHDILGAVGNTPLVELRHVPVRPGVRLFAKLEGMNPSGSIKDRIALAMVEEAEEQGRLRPGDTIVEASTGNTALALALISRQRGYKLKVVMPTRVAPGIAELLQLFGAAVVWCEPKVGMKSTIDMARQLGQEPGHVALLQFENQANVRAHYEGTAVEILKALPQVDAFVAGIGTGGTLTGVGRRLKEANPGTQVVGVEPRFGEHLQGLRSLEEGYIPPLLDMALLDGRFLVGTQTAFQRARALARSEGILAGVSSGAVLHAALRLAERMERGNIVCCFADGGWKYLPSYLATFKPHDAKASADDIAWW